MTADNDYLVDLGQYNCYYCPDTDYVYYNNEKFLLFEDYINQMKIEFDKVYIYTIPLYDPEIHTMCDDKIISGYFKYLNE